MIHIGIKIKELLENKKAVILSVAKSMDTDRNNIYTLFKKQNPPILQVVKLCQATGLKLIDILPGEFHVCLSEKIIRKNQEIIIDGDNNNVQEVQSSYGTQIADNKIDRMEIQYLKKQISDKEIIINQQNEMIKILRNSQL